MKNSNGVSTLHDDGGNTQSEWSKISFDIWCREQAKEFVTVPGLRVVDLYKVVRSVIEQDLSSTERTAATMCWLEGKSAAAAAEKTGTSTANIYKALSRAKDKLRLVLKHLIDSEEYREEI